MQFFKTKYHIITFISEAPTVTNAGPSWSQRAVGDTFTFFCKTSAQGTVTWIRDGVTIDTVNDPNYKLTSSNDLVINKITPKDHGFYKCKVENEFGFGILGWDLRLIIPCK